MMLRQVFAPAAAQRVAPRSGKLVCWAAVLCACAVAGCTRMQSDSCSIDTDCAQGAVCREAVCRVPCMTSHWVGERVEVTGGKLSRQAEIASCDQRRFWVRYESGVEEQVDETRLVKRERR
jgi:hypothetical protein